MPLYDISASGIMGAWMLTRGPAQVLESATLESAPYVSKELVNALDSAY